MAPTPTQNERILWHISECLLVQGKTAFFDKFFKLINSELGADQCMVFRYDKGHAECLLSRNFNSRVKGEALAEAYISGGYKNDPLIKKMQHQKRNTTKVWLHTEIEGLMPPSYNQAFFVTPGIGSKISVLLAHASMRLCVSFYRTPDSPIDHEAWSSRQIWSTLAHLYFSHYTSGTSAAQLGPLAVLSDRERSICTGILRGIKMEQIAQECGISPATAVTYRQRAYAKLGINSRSALFSICT